VGILLASWQDSLDDAIDKLTEGEAKDLLNEIAVTLAGFTQVKAVQHDEIAEIFMRITKQQ